MYTYHDYMSGHCTFLDYVGALKIPKLEVGGVYVRSRGAWCEEHYTIMYCDEKIALGLCTYSAITKKPTDLRRLFDVATGFLYGDCRLEYRLEERLA